MDAQLYNYSGTEDAEPILSRKSQLAKNKYIVVGHPDSGFEEIASALKKTGMTEALPGLNEGLSAHKINRQLCEAHGISADEAMTDILLAPVKQLKISAIWHPLVLDLFRGNLSQPFWGWADPMSVFLLDFWKTISEEITFLLVYNHPRTALISSKSVTNLKNEKTNTVGATESIQAWQYYNEALLSFYHRNKDRSLLIHAEQLRDTAGSMLSQTVRNRCTPILQEMAQNDIPSVLWSDTPEAHHLKKLFMQPDSRLDIREHNEECHPLETFLTDSLLSHNSDAQQLYEELQAIATIPLQTAEGDTSDVPGAWQAYQNLIHTNSQIAAQNEEKRAQIDAQIETLNDLQKQLAEKGQLLLREKAEKQNAVQTLEQDYQLLLKQLQVVHEEIEKHFQDNQDKESKLTELTGKYNELLDQLKTEQKKAELHYIESMDKKRQIAELSDQYQQLKSELSKIKQQKSEIETKFASERNVHTNMLREYQEELVQRNIETKQLKTNQKPVFLGAAERQKSELVYLIGAAIIGMSRSFAKWKLLFYPIFIRRLIQQEALNHDTSDQWLPPLSEYQDYEEALKARKHLSYRLGVAWQKSHRGLGRYFRSPIAMLGAFRQWKQSRANRP